MPIALNVCQIVAYSEQGPGTASANGSRARIVGMRVTCGTVILVNESEN